MLSNRLKAARQAAPLTMAALGSKLDPARSRKLIHEPRMVLAILGKQNFDRELVELDLQSVDEELRLTYIRARTTN